MENNAEKIGIGKKIRQLYFKHLKKMLVLPMLLLVISLIVIANQIIKTGDFVNKDVSLKGGVVITIPTSVQIDIISLRNHLSSVFPGKDISIKLIKEFGTQKSILIEGDIEGTSSEIGLLIKETEEKTGIIVGQHYTAEIMGSALGERFFKEGSVAMIIAFLLMTVVVFVSFRVFAPCMAVILAAFSDMVITIAVVNILGIKIGTAGIATFLMLIGYSVDTDILLSTRVLKRHEGTVEDRVISSIKTGMLMTITAIVAASSALLITQSEVIKQIMTILLIGLAADIINTWIQNVAILLIYLERKKAKNEAKA